MAAAGGNMCPPAAALEELVGFAGDITYTVTGTGTSSQALTSLR